MAVWKEEDLKKIRRRLWYTADMTYVRGWFVALLVLEALFVGIMALKGGFDAFIWIFTTAAALVISMPILALCLWRTWQVYRHAEHYIFCRATLMSPHMNYLFRAMRFTVVLEDMDGNKFPANTSPIFHPYGFQPPVMEDYTGRTLTIGYNEKTGNIVVCN